MTTENSNYNNPLEENNKILKSKLQEILGTSDFPI